VLVERADYPRDDYDRVMAVNLRGVWSCMKFELQQMRKQRSGAIVNCSSLGGLIGGAQRATYHAAKHGVIGLTKSAALEYATRGIRVNDVCPGIIRTPMFDKMVEEGQGEAVLWLCSSAASYVTGKFDLGQRRLCDALEKVMSIQPVSVQRIKTLTQRDVLKAAMGVMIATLWEAARITPRRRE
jgi:NAD(P)-dependent dehydrogenase (short-subunit alcohol dehydrogenase family)